MYTRKILVVMLTLVVAPVLFPVEIIRVALHRRRAQRVLRQVVAVLRRRGVAEPRVWGEA